MVSSSDDFFLNYRVMHPCGANEPADPNGAFFMGINIIFVTSLSMIIDLEIIRRNHTHIFTLQAMTY